MSKNQIVLKDSIIMVLVVITIFSCFLAGLFVSIEEKRVSEKWIDLISTQMELNFEEARQMNLTNIMGILTGLNWTILNWGSDYRGFALEVEHKQYNLTIFIAGTEKLNNNSATLSGHLRDTFSETKYEEKKEWMIKKIQNVADICQITLTWSSAKWFIRYQNTGF